MRRSMPRRSDEDLHGNLGTPWQTTLSEPSAGGGEGFQNSAGGSGERREGLVSAETLTKKRDAVRSSSEEQLTMDSESESMNHESNIIDS